MKQPRITWKNATAAHPAIAVCEAMRIKGYKTFSAEKSGRILKSFIGPIEAIGEFNADLEN